MGLERRIVALGMIVLMLVIAGSVLAPDSAQSFPPKRVFGWFTVLGDIYDPEKVAGVAVYIDAKQVESESEARELGNRILDYIFVAPRLVRPGFEVGVQYPLTKKLMLEVEADSSQPYLASGLLSYQQFDHPDDRPQCKARFICHARASGRCACMAVETESEDGGQL